jgi:hypothetical protein
MTKPPCDIHVERDGNRWVIKSGKRQLKRYADTQLEDACRDAWERATAAGVAAWLVHVDRRTRIIFRGET